MNSKTFLKPWVFALGTVILMFLGALSLYGYVNSVRSEGIQHETALSAQYESNQNELSAYISSFYEQLGMADRKSAKLDTILSHAVQGRYGDNGFQPNGQMFSAIAEAYPDLTQNLSIYDDIAAHVRSGRTAFKNRQDLLLDRSRLYKTYLSDGLLRQQVVRMLGFPTDRLEARVGGTVVARGPAAFEQMQRIVVTGSTVEAFTSGRQEPLAAP